MNLFTICVVGLGGALGALTRYLIHHFMHDKTKKFPLGTFLVNIAGCFLMGFFSGFLLHDSVERNLICIGYIGSLTTFSTFIADTHDLNRKKHHFTNVVYILTSMVMCLAMMMLGEFCYSLLP